ncbi:hypothetical protein D3C76_1720800 [compost metagenome]
MKPDRFTQLEGVIGPHTYAYTPRESQPLKRNHRLCLCRTAEKRGRVHISPRLTMTYKVKERRSNA